MREKHTCTIVLSIAQSTAPHSEKVCVYSHLKRYVMLMRGQQLFSSYITAIMSLRKQANLLYSLTETVQSSVETAAMRHCIILRHDKGR